MILAVDPGQTTGLAIGCNIDWNTADFDLHYVGELKWSDRFLMQRMLERIKNTSEGLTQIVIERFLLYPNKAAELAYHEFPSSQLIGIIEMAAYNLGLLDRVSKHNASQRNSVQILEKHYPLIPRQSKHCRDAYKHLRYYIVMESKRRKHAARA